MELERMKAAHQVLAELEYEPKELRHGYADRTLFVDLGARKIELRPVSPYMKATFTGGKGFDLFLMWHALPREPIAWDDPRNELCISCGPLAGTPSYSGTSKALVTGISPTTGSVMDSNVGGHFGPWLKFCGFDALEIQGKASEDAVVVVDGYRNRVRLESAPLEPVDSYDLAELFHHMYAESPEQLQDVAVVSSGRAAQHTLIGCLNFSFWDYKRKTCRLKQAGRGGLGTVFRDKKLKALVARTPHNRPRWRMVVESP